MGPLRGAHRTERDKTRAGGRFYIRWTAWRGKGAPVIGNYAGATRADAEATERADAPNLAQAFAAARTHATSPDTVAGLLDLYQQSAEFKRCSDSTKSERARLIRQMREDPVPPPPGRPDTNLKLGTLPTAGLGSKLAVGHLTRWRDKVAADRGPRAADYRKQLLQRALEIMVAQGTAPANPAAKLGAVWRADRSDLIWRDDQLAAYRRYIKIEIDKAWRQKATVETRGRVCLNRHRFARIMQLAAARDALALAIDTGMRREDLAALSWCECSEVAFVYRARKGARRARTAGKKARTTIVPMLPDARRIIVRRLEAHGASARVIMSGRGQGYTPNALGELVNAIARKYLKAGRTLHDGKGTFVTRIKKRAPWLSNGEIAELVDWSEADVDQIIRRYVSADAIALAKIERLRRPATEAFA